MGTLKEVFSTNKIKGTINKIKMVAIVGVGGIIITTLLCAFVWKSGLENVEDYM